MLRRLGLTFVVFLLLLLPASSQAATILSGQTVSIATSTPGNSYAFGGTVNVDSPIQADLTAAGGNLSVGAPVAGDALLIGGTVRVDQPVAGDTRVVGGRVSVRNNIAGDLFAAAGYLTVAGKANYLYLLGNTVEITNGSNGTTTIYGVDVSLSGEFKGDVEVVASDKLTIADGTIIHGALKYNAPQQAELPDSAHVDGGVEYIGNAPFVPTPKQAHTFAVAGLWIFYAVRIIAALITVGLIVGFFPVLTDRVIESTLTRSFERFMLLMLLGFSAFVAVPVLLLLLTISFVGIGPAILIGAAYVLFLLLSYIYAAALAGSAIMWSIRKHTAISWREALLGVLVLEIIGIVPVVGFVVKLVLAATAGGALLVLFYKFAFRRTAQDIQDLMQL